MAIPLPRTGLFPIALAILGFVLAPGGNSAHAETARDRAARMAREGCCCVTPGVNCCCCEDEAPAEPESAAPGVVLRADSSSSKGRCGCRAPEPALPCAESERGDEDGRPDLDATPPGGGIVAPGRSPFALSHPFGLPIPGPPRAAIYLLTSHLLI